MTDRIQVRDLVRSVVDWCEFPLLHYGIVQEKRGSGATVFDTVLVEDVNGSTQKVTEDRLITILRVGQTISWDDKGCGVVMSILLEKDGIKVRAFGEWGSLETIPINEIVPFDLEIQFGGDEILSIDWQWFGLEFRDNLNDLENRHYESSFPIHPHPNSLI